MHSRIENIEIMINAKANKVVEELFQSLLSGYQIGMETSMKGSNFAFDCVNLLCYKCHKKDLR